MNSTLVCFKVKSNIKATTQNKNSKYSLTCCDLYNSSLIWHKTFQIRLPGVSIIFKYHYFYKQLIDNSRMSNSYIKNIFTSRSQIILEC